MDAAARLGYTMCRTSAALEDYWSAGRNTNADIASQQGGHGMAQAKVKRVSDEQVRNTGLGSCMYVGRFHEVSDETYRRYKQASQRFAEIAERQAKGE